MYPAGAVSCCTYRVTAAERPVNIAQVLELSGNSHKSLDLCAHRACYVKENVGTRLENLCSGIPGPDVDFSATLVRHP